MNDKRDVIVYGLGKEFEKWRTWIEKKYHVLGYSDSDMEKSELYCPFLKKTELRESQADILITTSRYYEEIRDMLLKNGVDAERIRGGVEEIIAPPVIVVVVMGGFSGLMMTYSFAMAVQKRHPELTVYLDMDWYELETNAWFKKFPDVFNKLFHISLDSIRADEETIRRAKRQGTAYEDAQEVGVYCEKYLKVEQGYMWGYWYTKKYLLGIEDELAERFRFDESYMSPRQREVLEKIRNTESVAVWVRRGDFLNEENVGLFGNICTEAYYDRSINYIRERYPHAEFFVFSNDSDYITEKYSEYNLVLYDEGTTEIKDYDMYLMASCKHLILANSGFSFWAALLHGDNGIIISPEKFMNDRPSTDLWEEHWIRMQG